MNKNILKSIGAILAGFILVAVLSIVTDLILERTDLMNQPFDLNPVWFIVFVIFYRSLFSVIGSYLTAKLAPGRPMRHAMIGGAIGLAISITGAIVMWDVPPRWYAVSLIITALPCAWLGGKIYMLKSKSI